MVTKLGALPEGEVLHVNSSLPPTEAVPIVAAGSPANAVKVKVRYPYARAAWVRRQKAVAAARVQTLNIICALLR
ncbi:MAG: hypothetical protein M1541_16315 [Acidobacteria bacterium]|nr:hypothetical protein [Acidobacteriota bacterium]